MAHDPLTRRKVYGEIRVGEREHRAGGEQACSKERELERPG